MKKQDKDAQYILTKYGKTFTALGRADWDYTKDNIKWAEKEYKEWMKEGWKKVRKGGLAEFVDFPRYLKNKYK
jgi:hypothetical protein